MSTLIITTNASQGTDVTIGDMGIVIASSGGSETFTDSRNLLPAQLSVDLRTLTQDDAHGANSSTLILNDGTNDIDQADVDSYLSEVSTGVAIADAVAIATADTTTTSTSDVLVNSMSISSGSLPAGDYAVWFSGSLSNAANNIAMELSIYDGTVAAGSQIASSERRVAMRTGSFTPFACFALVTVDGTENIEGAWRTASGTATMHERSIYALRVG